MEFLCLIHLTTPSTPSMLTFLPLSNTKLQGGPLEPFLQRYSLKFGPFDRAAIFDVLVRGERVAHGHKPNTKTQLSSNFLISPSSRCFSRCSHQCCKHNRKLLSKKSKNHLYRVVKCQCCVWQLVPAASKWPPKKKLMQI